MNGFSSINRRAACLSLLALLASVAERPAPGRAAEFFHGEPRQVRACTLLLPSTAAAQSSSAPDGQNQNPYVFYVMDQRTDLRPESWEFVNPMAPPAMMLRWTSGDRPFIRSRSIAGAPGKKPSRWG